MKLKHLKTISECLELNDHIGLPTDFEDIVKNSFTKHLAYKDVGLPVHHCDSCGHEFRVQSKHGQTLNCPNCHLELKAFHTKSNTHYDKHTQYMLINRIEKLNNEFIHTRYLAEMKIKNKLATYRYELREIKVLDGIDLSVYSYIYAYGYGMQWTNKCVSITQNGYSFYGNLEHQDVYPKSFQQFFENTDIKYSCLGLALDQDTSYQADVIGCIQTARKYKYLEFLWKTNNKDLYYSTLSCVPMKRELNFVIKNHKKLFRLGGWKEESIKVLWEAFNTHTLTPELIQIINSKPRIYANALNAHKSLKGLKGVQQIMKYLSNQTHIQFYEDYLRLMDKIQTPVDNATVFPKDLRKAHDDAMNKFNAIQLEIRNDNAKKVLTKAKSLEFKLDELEILAPSSLNEILQEGRTLIHCVGSYVDRVVSGSTMILFVRKSSDPSVPYYTLEYQNKKIMQVRGLRNERMTDEVKEFTDKWLKHINKQKRKRVEDRPQCSTQ